MDIILNPYPQTPSPRWRVVYAWWALHRAEPFGIHARHPCRAYNRGLSPLAPIGGCRPSTPCREKYRLIDKLSDFEKHAQTLRLPRGAIAKHTKNYFSCVCKRIWLEKAAVGVQRYGRRLGKDAVSERPKRVRTTRTKRSRLTEVSKNAFGEPMWGSPKLIKKATYKSISIIWKNCVFAVRGFIDSLRLSRVFGTAGF